MTEKKWERLEPTFSLEDERLASLKQIVPEAFTDGKVDFEQLRALLGEAVEDESAEHFGLNWTGKREARRLAGMPSKGTLVPVPGKGLHEDTTENIFIEGDNLEVLKLLHKSYRGKIKMIYIDPPYNTGNDLIYKDDYRMPLESYLQRSGQKSDMGELLTSNPKSSGRFHSDWLNMMYPRLRVARDLLREDGVIFVSIDDNEVHNLRQMMSEVFGEENYISTISFVSNWKGRSDDKYIATAHEYLVVFQMGNFASYGLPLPPEYLKDYTESDENGNPYRLLGLRKRGDGARREDRPNMYYPFFASTSGKVSLQKSSEFTIEITPKLSDGSDGRWRWGKETSEERISELKARNVTGTERHDVFQMDFAEIDGTARRIKPKSVWMDSSLSGEAGTLAYKTLMGKIKFSNPKSVELLKTCIRQAARADDLVLDFFSGSGTLGHSIYELNSQEEYQLKYICVQIGEPVQSEGEYEKAGIKSISDITAERLRRAANAVETERSGKLDTRTVDSGFLHYRLGYSNFKAWSDYHGNDLDELRGLLQAQIDSTFVEGAKEDAILTEIVLLEGFPLTSNIEIDETFQKNRVRRISHDWLEHRLFVTLDKEIQEETVRMAEDLEKIDIFICLDNALTDQDKLRLADVCRLKTI